MATIGFIGTGGMGSEMAANLMKAGHSLVVNDIRPEMTRRFADKGAQTRGSAREVAEASEVVYSMLPYNEAVTEVGVGKGGLHEAAGGARLWVDFSSTNKKTIVDAGQKLSAKGWHVLDASVAGVEEQAAAAALSIWVSGSKRHFEDQLPMFQAMGKKIVYMGDLGNAKLVKTANAMLGAISNMCMAEIFYWLKKGGLTEEDFQNFIKSSQNYSPALDRITQIMISRKFKPRKSWMPKDVGFGLDEARVMEVPVPFSSLAYQMFTLAQANGVDGYEATGIAFEVYSLMNGKGKTAK
jgi:2-hydroxy-3-oxopropionate reductase